VQSELETMSIFINLTVSYRSLSDTALVICDESQLDECFGPGEVVTYQPDFDTRVEYRNIQTDQGATSESAYVVGLQIIGARERRDSGLHEARIPPQLLRLISGTIESVPKIYHPHETWVQAFEVPVIDLLFRCPDPLKPVDSLADVKAVSAALDDMGVAHQSLMLRTGKSDDEPRKLLSREFRTLWSQLADEVDQSQGLRPTTAVVRTLNALTVHTSLPMSIQEATQRSLVHILHGGRWREVADTLREATWALNHIAIDPAD
jgi:hypothetical protein